MKIATQTIPIEQITSSLASCLYPVPSEMMLALHSYCSKACVDALLHAYPLRVLATDNNTYQLCGNAVLFQLANLVLEPEDTVPVVCMSDADQAEQLEFLELMYGIILNAKPAIPLAEQARKQKSKTFATFAKHSLTQEQMAQLFGCSLSSYQRQVRHIPIHKA